MIERLIKLKILVDELRNESFGDQYSIADWVDKNEGLNSNMKKLSKESEFYQKILIEIKEFLKH